MKTLVVTVAVIAVVASLFPSASPAEASSHSGTFVDDDDSIFEADIEWLAGTGITRGCNPPANDQFCPDQSVTRGQFAAFLKRAFDALEKVPSAPESTDPEQGDDVSTSPSAQEDEPIGDSSNVQEGSLPDGYPGEALELYGSSVHEGELEFAPDRIPEWDPTNMTVGVVQLPSKNRGSSDPGAFELQGSHSLFPQPVLGASYKWLSSSYLPKTVGKLYMWYGLYLNNGKPYYGQCSATLVWSNVVLTAAHCVDDAIIAGKLYTPIGFWFIPDAYGSAGVAYWGERRVFHSEWQYVDSRLRLRQRWYLDYALVSFNRGSDGLYPGEKYGWETPWYNNGDPSSFTPIGSWPKYVRRSDAYYYTVGYPAEGYFEQFNNYNKQAESGSSQANWPWYCTSRDTLQISNGLGYGEISMGCLTNGGHSGGPVFEVVNGKRRLVSVASNVGHPWSCAAYGSSTGCRRWTSSNLWFPRLLNDPGGHGFDDVWRVMFTTAHSGGI